MFATVKWYENIWDSKGQRVSGVANTTVICYA